MAAHSPGPWVLAKSGVSVDAGATRIRMEASADREEIKANARLIAAAPELLDALKAMIAECGDPWITNQGDSQLMALIAKAEGR